MYYTYLMDTKFIESVTSTGIVGNNSYGSVQNYFSLFYSVSRISLKKRNKVVLDSKLADTILTRSYEFIIHEKKLLEYDFMGEKDECENKFLVISELVALVYCEAIQNKLIAEIYPIVNKIKQELENCKINTIAIDMLEMIEKNELKKCVNAFENVILTKNKRDYSSAFTGIQCLVFINQDSSQDISFEKFFAAIKYLDIEYAKTLWIQLAPLLRQPFFWDEEAQKYIASSISKCIDIYVELANKGERYYLDGLYNCTAALYQYHKCINTAEKMEVDELTQCVGKAMKIENYEIANIWAY